MQDQSTWKSYKSVWYKLPETTLSNIDKVAIFDLDWTLVKPLRTKFPQNPQDNVIMPNRVAVLKQYTALGYLPVIISNQKLTPKEILIDKIARMNDVIKKFKTYDINLLIIMATRDDEYRKPNIGMYSLLFDLIPSIKIGFYSGDAAGRSTDFADSDLKFAENAGIPFYLPEQLFGE